MERSSSDPRGSSASSGTWTPATVDFDQLLVDIDRRREALGISLAEVARQSGVNASKLSILRKGEAISINNLCRLCDWLGHGVDDYRRTRSETYKRQAEIFNQTQALIRAGDVAGLAKLLSEGQDARVDEMMESE